LQGTQIKYAAALKILLYSPDKRQVNLKILHSILKNVQVF